MASCHAAARCGWRSASPRRASPPWSGLARMRKCGNTAGKTQATNLGDRLLPRHFDPTIEPPCEAAPGDGMLCVRANEFRNKKKSAGETLVTRTSLLAIVDGCRDRAAGPSTAQAQDYPNRPIRVLTTTSAGGLSDIFMRALGDELGRRMGTTFVIENRPGGMQNVGTRACSESPPDGYTICIINADPLVYNQWLLKSMPFNPETALQPIVNLYHLIHIAGGQRRPEGEDRRRAGRAVEGASPARSTTSRPARRWCSTWRRCGRSAAPTGCGCRSAAAARRSTRSWAARRRSACSAKAMSSAISAPAT